MQPIVELGFHSSAVEGGLNQCATVLRGHPLEVEACGSSVLSGFRVHSSISKSEVSVLIDLETKSVKKLVVEPLATVDLGLNSAAILMSPTIFSSMRWSSARSKRGWSGACARVRLQSDCLRLPRAAIHDQERCVATLVNCTHLNVVTGPSS